MGNTCKPMAVTFQCMTKFTTNYKKVKIRFHIKKNSYNYPFFKQDYWEIKWNIKFKTYFRYNSVQSLSHVRLFGTPWTTVHQASLSITDSQRLFILMSIDLVIPSNHLIICRPLHLPPLIIPSIRVFSNESVLRIRCPKYRSFSFTISLSNEY